MSRPQSTAVAGPPPSEEPRYSPYRLADLLGQPQPTPQQAAVVASPVAPLLVVAGAGSGKTETMAARVVYLVANGYVRPERVLGLTFTRKAAGGLAQRIRQRLGQLARTADFAGPRATLLAGEPTVSTYHSYAARVVSEHGLRAGYEPTTRLLSEAACWQLADAVVRGYDGDMSAVDLAPATVTDEVLGLSADLAEHLCEPADVVAFTDWLERTINALPGRAYVDVTKLVQRQRARVQLLPLVEAYEVAKRSVEAMDFGDQLARAALVARDHPAVGAVERERYRVVLLDEYQDTSHAQLVLLRSLFSGGHPVTAVGDPCQSIYAWRGASTEALDRFPEDFPLVDGRPATVRQLSVSWRNVPPILDVANTLSAPLRARSSVATLEPPEGRSTLADGRRHPSVRCGLFGTSVDEAGWLAERIATRWRAAGWAGPTGGVVSGTPTTAVLVRSRRQIPVLEAALHAQGLPVEVVGLGGLLDTPEVREIVCTLQVLSDPAAGGALLRLLTGPRWRIGPRDLIALYRRSKTLAQRRREQPPARPTADGQPDGGEAGDGQPGDRPLLTDRLDEATLVEALDNLGGPTAYSAEGNRRLVALRDELRALRRRLDQALPDLVADVERTLGLDVEVAARGGEGGLARGHLDAFGDVAAEFAGEIEGATLSSFLAFLAAAEDAERGLEPGHVEVIEGAVQLLTVHAAKGLEWDVVAVAGLTHKVFPSGQPSDQWLNRPGSLPFPLRGDRAALPTLDLAGAVSTQAVKEARARFLNEWKTHDETEERRLAYVAVTRPRGLLLCSGYWWDDAGKLPRGPSVFLEEIRDRCTAGAGVVDGWTAPPPDGATNPLTEHPAQAVWPSDPLGPRRQVMEQAAGLVRAALADLEAAADASGDAAAGTADSAAAAPTSADLDSAAAPADGAGAPAVVGAAAAGGDRPDPVADQWAYEVDLLLAERERLRPGPHQVVLPDQLSVSQLVALRGDPQALARRIRRPLPERPDPYARRGTAFHRWLEQRYGADRLLDVDELPGAADEGAAPDESLVELQQRFDSSEWAELVPVAVEVPFTTVLAGTVIRGRMDAVFRDPDGSYQVVDWKTGRPPTGARAVAAAVQLAAYRMAWAELVGEPVERVRAAFHYVRADETVRPVDLLGPDELVRLVADLPEVDAVDDRSEARP